MVFLTAITCALKDHFHQCPKWALELRSPSRLWKRNQQKRLSAKYQGRARNCYVIGVLKMNRGLRYSTNHAAMKAETLDRLFETRITAACLEHGMDKQYFLTSLAEFDISLNRETLANLAIYEPRTFQSLVEFVKMRSQEIGLQSKELGSVKGTDVRGLVDKVKQASSSFS